MNGSKKVLIIDDEEDLQQLMKLKFEQEGFIVLLASDGVIALKILEEGVPNIIILDIVMPNMDGYTFLKEMRKMPSIKNVPVLVVSGKEEDKVRDLFAFQKISGYIEKPFDIAVLISKVKQILGM